MSILKLMLLLPWWEDSELDKTDEYYYNYYKAPSNITMISAEKAKRPDYKQKFTIVTVLGHYKVKQLSKARKHLFHWVKACTTWLIERLWK